MKCCLNTSCLTGNKHPDRNGNFMQSNTRARDENLMIVTAVEEYSFCHGLPACDVIRLFRERGITDAIRSQYNALHTQDLSECMLFAQDMLRGIEQNVPEANQEI